METCKGLVRGFTCIVAAAIMAAASGCDTFRLRPTIQTKSATELAVAAIQSEWLKHCEDVKGPMPANSIGNLHLDNLDAQEALALCIGRHNAFVDYMRPIVQKERGGAEPKP